ncbi:CLUMA_CG004203, isoform A [Clunio marinus]|uniref:CLUMA_CG004203, isoform A n=1 Tax=Clunio marinus TaxID=568069 RepID=A0A1J1HR14_9DIPT|nr:CLUMA_CG004203, isoform A [Clunio marinus]
MLTKKAAYIEFLPHQHKIVSGQNLLLEWIDRRLDVSEQQCNLHKMHFLYLRWTFVVDASCCNIKSDFRFEDELNECEIEFESFSIAHVHNAICVIEIFRVIKCNYLDLSEWDVFHCCEWKVEDVNGKARNNSVQM